MADLSRRGFFTGRFLRERVSAAPPEVARTDGPVRDDVAELLARSRNRAPWERSTPTATAGRVARVLTFDCLVTLGSTCASCIERCPEPGALLSDGRHAPRIDPAACTGCGDCVLACPAPHPAIALGPA